MTVFFWVMSMKRISYLTAGPLRAGGLYENETEFLLPTNASETVWRMVLSVKSIHCSY